MKESANVYNRGLDAFKNQNYDLAITDFSEAIRLKPDYVEAYNNRGLAYGHKGEYDRAIADETQAIRLDPKHATAYLNRGLAYDSKGDHDRAIADYSEAIRLKPDDFMAYGGRGNAYSQKGEYATAIADFSEAIRLKPDSADGYNNLAWLLAVCPDTNIRNGEKAVEYAKKACELSDGKTGPWFDTLAAACAEAGRFDDAVRWQNEYLESNSSKDDWEQARQRLSLYEQKKPYHEEKP